MANDRAIAHTTLGIIGNIASCLFFLSSAPTVIRMVRSKSTGGISGDLYVFKLFNCLLWTLYGLPFVHPHDFWVVLTNSFGCVFSLMYIIPYLCYANRKEKVSLLSKLCAIISSFIIMVVLLFVLEHSQRNRILVVGILSAVISSAMHMALLSQCGMAIESKDPKYLHPDTSLAAFIKGAIWTIYGIVNFDIFIVVPNGVGVLIGVIEVVMVVILLSKRSKELELGGGSCEDKGSKRNSMELPRSKRNSMELPRSKKNSLEIPRSKRYSMDIPRSKRNSMEVNLESMEMGLLESEIYEQTQAGVTPPLIVSRVSSLLGLPRQGSMSSAVVPIFIDENEVEVSTIHMV